MENDKWPLRCVSVSIIESRVTSFDSPFSIFHLPFSALASVNGEFRHVLFHFQQNPQERQAAVQFFFSDAGGGDRLNPIQQLARRRSFLELVLLPDEIELGDNL